MGAGELAETDPAGRVDPPDVEVGAGLAGEVAPERKRALLPGGIAPDEETDLGREERSNVRRLHAVLDGEKASSADASEARKPGLREAERVEASADDIRHDDKLSTGAEEVHRGEKRRLVEWSTRAIGGPGAVVERIGLEALGP
jgi:hypothetical protein